MDPTIAFKGYLRQVEHLIVEHLGGDAPAVDDTLVGAARHLVLGGR